MNEIKGMEECAVRCWENSRKWIWQNLLRKAMAQEGLFFQ
jgi:hypothetical protein